MANDDLCTVLTTHHGPMPCKHYAKFGDLLKTQRFFGLDEYTPLWTCMTDGLVVGDRPAHDSTHGPEMPVAVSVPVGEGEGTGRDAATALVLRDIAGHLLRGHAMVDGEWQRYTPAEHERMGAKYRRGYSDQGLIAIDALRQIADMNDPRLPQPNVKADPLEGWTHCQDSYGRLWEREDDTWNSSEHVFVSSNFLLERGPLRRLGYIQTGDGQ